MRDKGANSGPQGIPIRTAMKLSQRATNGATPNRARHHSMLFGPITYCRKLSPAGSIPRACANLPLPILTLHHQPAINPPARQHNNLPNPFASALRPPSQWPPLRPSFASPPAAASLRPSSTPAPSSGPRPSPALPSSRPSPPTSAPRPSCAPASTPRRPLRSSPPGTNDPATQWFCKQPVGRLDCVGGILWGGQIPSL